MGGLHGSVFSHARYLVDRPCAIALDGGRDIAAYFGAATPLMTGWLAATGIGYFIPRLHCRSRPVRIFHPGDASIFRRDAGAAAGGRAPRAAGSLAGSLPLPSSARRRRSAIPFYCRGAIAGGFFDEQTRTKLRVRHGYVDGHPCNGRGDLRDPRGRLLADGICSADAARPQHFFSYCRGGRFSRWPSVAAPRQPWLS